MGLRVVLQKRSLRVKGMGFVGSKLMILADFVLIRRASDWGTLSSIFVALGGGWNAA